MMKHIPASLPLSRREMLLGCGTGWGCWPGGTAGGGEAALGESAGFPSGAFQAARQTHHPRVHERRPSQVDTFDPKPALARYQGQRPASIAGLKTENGTGGLRPSPFKFGRHGKSGLEVSEIFPEVARCADDLCVLRSMWTNVPNHEPSMYMMNSGHVQSLRPSYGSWLLYGLGTRIRICPATSFSAPACPSTAPRTGAIASFPAFSRAAISTCRPTSPRAT